jgi:ABC-type transport system substrate-binding protein
MKDSRAGEYLWFEWPGEDHEHDGNLLFFTTSHVDTENDVVRRALASALQRDGIIDSLAQGYVLAENATIKHVFAGVLDGERDFILCDETGKTHYGDFVNDASAVTLAEIRCQV